jgi:hypothetical protein
LKNNNKKKENKGHGMDYAARKAKTVGENWNRKRNCLLNKRRLS